jgi:uncharacterized protein (UPF0548 family)
MPATADPERHMAARKKRHGGGDVRVGRRLRRRFRDLRHRSLNFDPRQRAACGTGWYIDDYRQALPPEPPGPPVPGGSWEIARRFVRDYAFADPALIRHAYRSGPPAVGRDMLLEAHFYGLRFYLGVRVGGVVDGVIEEDGRPTRVWGWNYQTLQGHLKCGQMAQEVRKRLDTGEVEFSIHAYSRGARIPNPIVRLGYALFGRYMQILFYRRACRRMRTLTARAIAP